MKILIACEYSGIVRDAFLEKGHDAISCDILPTESKPEKHCQGDVMDIINDGWDMMIGFPPCTYLSYAGTRSWNDPGRVWKRLDALAFFAKLWDAPIDKICLENPKGCASPTIAKYSQIIQPYQFGDPYIKTTCLWIKGLPKLEYNPRGGLFKSTEVEPIGYHVDASGSRAKQIEIMKRKGMRVTKESFGKTDQHERSRFWPGIAKAMASQWG